MLVGKWQEQELLPASVPSYCQIREPILCALEKSRRVGKKAETQWVLVLQNEAESWGGGRVISVRKSHYYSILVFSI